MGPFGEVILLCAKQNCDCLEKYLCSENCRIRRHENYYIYRKGKK